MGSDGAYVVTAPAGWKPDALETWAAENLLYPELAAHGQLAKAIAATAAEMAADVGTVAPASSDPRRWANIASRMPHRKPLGIGIGAVERWFLISGWSRGVSLVSGSTADLAEIVRAAVAWRSGASLKEIQSAAAFVKVSDLALAHEQGPADAVAAQWRALRESWASDDRFRFVADIIEAAYAAPALRQLFPYTSHASLCFSTCTGFPYSQDVPRVDPGEGGGYVLRTRFMGDMIGEAEDAESAIAILLAHLPDGIGPAVADSTDPT